VLENRLFLIDRVNDGLLSALENREIALWIGTLRRDPADRDALAAFLGLPWKMVLSDGYDPKLFNSLETQASAEDPLVRKRGFVQIVDADPARINFPQRCLPIFLLNGRQNGGGTSDFSSRLRRMTMLEELRRSGIRRLLVISFQGDPIPADLRDLWSDGFRASLTFVSDNPDSERLLSRWIDSSGGRVAADLLSLSTGQAIQDILARYAATYPEERRVIRIRDAVGVSHKIDVTGVDEPERPISELYSLIEERDLALLTPDELSEADFIGFFRDPTTSWKPYAAGLPWVRNPQCSKILNGYLRKLDSAGSEANCITHISSESGAGGTTLARSLAWECARAGYPVLLAKQVPFVPDALPIVNYLNRVHNAVGSQVLDAKVVRGAKGAEENSSARLYQCPWLIVFDSFHWQYREAELVSFVNAFEKSGRPVCVLVVTGTILGEAFVERPLFKELAELSHAIESSEAQQLGEHLNKFLRHYGKQRASWQWDQFYRNHTVNYLDGIAAFWVTLSFWIQGQYDLSESIQEWMYRSFKQNSGDRIVQEAVLRIAALSTERLPLPEILLPQSNGAWPTSQLLLDARSSLAALGLVNLSAGGEKYWALIHDILGRFLINALFYDFSLRDALGFAAAKDPEHLRFLLLRQISVDRVLGERAYRQIGEEFATSIFKIDPDHGHSNFVAIWREVINALHSMPKPLRDTSRLFRHHTAISSRRIAKLDEKLYNVTQDEKISLLTEAINDINYALTHIAYVAGSEPNLNLFNSLANAYFDLAELETARGAKPELIAEIRQLANDATRHAFDENPTNSFVIETYVKNLLQSAATNSPVAIEQCVEALGILFSALSSKESAYRASQLGSLADRAVHILFQKTPPHFEESKPKNAIDVLVSGWTVLAARGEAGGGAWTGIPQVRLDRALQVLADPAGRGNMQVIRLRYDLICISQPFAFSEQLELVEQLQASNYRTSPQLRLEYAILLYQNARFLEGDKAFRTLRHLWHESEHFVEVPERLRWLRGNDPRTLKIVHARVGSDSDLRPMAHVEEFGSSLVPFRPEEHGLRDWKAGSRFTCHVSFGHNGPFLRPVTAGARG